MEYVGSRSSGAGAATLERRAARRERRRARAVIKSEQAQECSQCGSYAIVYGKREVCADCRRANAERMREARAVAAQARHDAGPPSADEVDDAIREYQYGRGALGTRYMVRFHEDAPWTALRVGMDAIHRLAFEYRLDLKRMGDALEQAGGLIEFVRISACRRADECGLDGVEVMGHIQDEVTRWYGCDLQGGRGYLAREWLAELEQVVERGACGWCGRCVVDEGCEEVEGARAGLERLKEARERARYTNDTAATAGRAESKAVRVERDDAADVQQVESDSDMVEVVDDNQDDDQQDDERLNIEGLRSAANDRGAEHSQQRARADAIAKTLAELGIAV